MSAEHSVHRLLLRAELRHGTARTVTHTVELSESLLFVHTEEHARIGDKVMVEMSFPGLVEPFSIETQVVAKQGSGPAGQSPGWMLGFVLYREEEQDWLRGMLRRVAGPDEERRKHPYRILLVDDNELTRLAFSLAANRYFGTADAGAILDIVPDVGEAKERLHSSCYDLAIVDYFLPVLTGDRLIDELRRDSDLGELPIFAISIGGPEARHATLDAGADLFLPKPIVVRDLFDTLSMLIRPLDSRGNRWHHSAS